MWADGQPKLNRLDGFELSWLIETSPENYQGGIILAEPLADDRAIEPLGAAAGSGKWQTKICRPCRRAVSVSPNQMAA
jgi:hypothetical protein